jgi:hypothetical protein
MFFNNTLKKIDMYRFFHSGEVIYAKFFINSCSNFITQGNFEYAIKAIKQLLRKHNVMILCIPQLQEFIKKFITRCILLSEK